MGSHRAKAVSAESVHIALASSGKRVTVSFQPRDSQRARHAMPTIELSQRAAGRLGRALIRKDAEITGIAGIKPVVTDGLSLAILHEIYDTLTAGLGDRLQAVDRHALTRAKNLLASVLARIESGVSHG